MMQMERYTPKQRRLLLACLLEITKRNIGKSITEAIDEKYRYIHDAANYVTDHFGERLTSDSIAKQFLVSTRKLENDFKSVMSMTLRQYSFTFLISAPIMRGVPHRHQREKCMRYSSSVHPPV